MRFSLLNLVSFFSFFLLFATGFITPVNKDYQYVFQKDSKSVHLTFNTAFLHVIRANQLSHAATG